MANNLIFDSQTRIISRITTEDPPTLSVNEDYVSVSDDYVLQGENKKLGEDDLTQVDPTEQELNTYFDIISPQRVIMRTVQQKIQDYIDSLPGEETAQKNFLLALKAYFIAG